MKKIVFLMAPFRQEKIFGEKYFAMMRPYGELCFYDRPDFDDRAYVLDFVKGANYIITTWGSPRIEKDILDVCPDLIAVMHAAGSPKPVISDELIARNIRVTYSAIALGEGVAETALTMAISAIKGLFILPQRTAAGEWGECKLLARDFYDITVGVISGGFVGRHMIKLLQNFNVDVLLYDPFVTEEQAAAMGAKKAELNELLAASDVISIHAPSIPATDNMLNASNLPLIKDGAVLINTARGSIIDEAALIAELKKNRFFACIDVTNPEPPAVDNELRTLPNVRLTPHIAGAIANGQKRIAKHICEELTRCENGERMRTELDANKLATMA